MKKRYIVKENKDFNDIINTCKYSKDPNLVIYYKDNNLAYDRFGISVSTKFGNAVERNLYKRRLRSIIDTNKNNYQIKKDYIIIVRKAVKEATYSVIEESYKSLMDKINR